MNKDEHKVITRQAWKDKSRKAEAQKQVKIGDIKSKKKGLNKYIRNKMTTKKSIDPTLSEKKRENNGKH